MMFGMTVSLAVAAYADVNTVFGATDYCAPPETRGFGRDVKSAKQP